MKNIARLRKLNGWTQNDLADACGVEQPTISKAERGVGGTSLKVYQSIANALEVPLYLLFMDEVSEAEVRLIRVYRDLPEARKQGWQDILSLAEAEIQATDQYTDQVGPG
ncbi:helix-turn-helix transcriptional regulator [Pelagimonas sp. KU-00592-HH]|uniref:helix-turn-helix domain-containing protein n=1 Tax=Pelagimonas sp. KU-00592-HH TaxID=3127651 RepID=UPI00333ED86A